MSGKSVPAATDCSPRASECRCAHSAGAPRAASARSLQRIDRSRPDEPRTQNIAADAEKPRGLHLIAMAELECHMHDGVFDALEQLLIGVAEQRAQRLFECLLRRGGLRLVAAASHTVREEICRSASPSMSWRHTSSA